MKKTEPIAVEQPQEPISEIFQRRVLPQVETTFKAKEADRERLERLRSTLKGCEAKAEKLKEDIPALEARVISELAEGEDPEGTQRELREAREAADMTQERIQGLQKSLPAKEQGHKESTSALRTQIREVLAPIRAEYQASLDRKVDEAMDLLDSWRAAIEGFHQGLGLPFNCLGESPQDALRVIGLQIRSHPRLKVFLG